jgi:hypothetical protein
VNEAVDSVGNSGDQVNSWAWEQNPVNKTRVNKKGKELLMWVIF